MMLRYISTLSYFAMQDIKGPFEIPRAAARAAITSFVPAPKIRILAVKTTQRGFHTHSGVLPGILAPLWTASLKFARAYALYHNVIPNDVSVFLGEGAKWESLPRCKVSNDCAVRIENPAAFVEPPDQDVYFARFLLSVVGDLAVNPSVRGILTGA